MKSTHPQPFAPKPAALCLALLLGLGLAALAQGQAAEEVAIFTQNGTIEELSEQSIRIDDCSYLFSPTSHFLKANGSPTTLATFKVKDRISFQASNKGEILALSLAAALPAAPSRGDEPPAPAAPPPALPKPNEIIFENGKWHN